ncbi:Gfo/Idh/MocA family protein [Microbacterium ulmi]|uniref:Gfo/Idh/MocA family oxidoreductase n=1 Tax=Microbacterium ulmi TaxID=179095 RepID=A0A7Y2M2L6_9MICO|nr:Gfo/Idh/MocA family oxidoreductase [Microbacterium ulmi]NII69049.1 putative dehydrogenase [Microbacterium ulmi]NNH04629.1 Gfo/Idh/MocA family oxidoreductase [Microbacterium ulmi]
MTSRIRYALVGAGSRAQMYVDAITGPHADVAELVAWSDTNDGRLDWHEARVLATGAPAPLRFAPEQLATAIAEHGIQRVIITSPDFTHAGHVVTALEAGADAIVEKPLTTSEEGVRRIAEAAERTGRSVTVTFNYRYSPRNSALKQVIASGAIGDVTSVHFEWVLDTAHGADYFRRWHRDKANSGGLLIHKASHHFDLVNWWIADAPTRVFASGGLRFYGAENAARRGLGQRPERGSVDSPLRDAFSLDLRDDETLKGLYLDQEGHDGYLRDRDVFDRGITIEDNLSLVVDYAQGASMSYSLNAHAPWEGYTVAVNGTAGRAELTVVERGAVLVAADGKPVVDPSARPDAVAHEDARPVSERLVVQRHFQPAEEVAIPAAEGGHGGGDAVLLREVFVGRADDPLGRAASWLDGVRSMAVGLAGNRSLETGQAVRTADLGLGPAAAALAGVPEGAESALAGPREGAASALAGESR